MLNLFETIKRIVPVVLIGAMLFVATSCLNNAQGDKNAESGDAFTGNWTGSSLSTNTGIDDPLSPDNEDQQEDKLSKYSQLVRDMMQDENIKSLLAQGEKDPIFYSSPYFEPHPYSFFEEQGHDIGRVKAGELECRTQSFIKKDDAEKNNLYIATYIENANGYYTEYLLKYELSDKEIQDYDYLHHEKYVHAALLNNWISSNKACQIISKLDVDKETHKGLEKRLRVENSVEETLKTTNEPLFLVFHSLDTEDRYFNVYVMKYVEESHNMRITIRFSDIPMRAWKNFDFDNGKLLFTAYDRANYDIYTTEDYDLVTSYYCQATDLKDETVRKELD